MLRLPHWLALLIAILFSLNAAGTGGAQPNTPQVAPPAGQAPAGIDSERLRARLGALDMLIDDFCTQLEARDGVLDDLRHPLGGRDGLVENLRTRMGSFDALADSLRDQLRARDGVLDTLRGELAKKVDLLGEVEGEVSRVADRAASALSDAIMARQKLARLGAELKASAEARQAFEAEVVG
jgi:hypothetical protein